MSFLMRKVAHCDVCGHEWLTSKVPTHCAKCKSRKWNQCALQAAAESFVKQLEEKTALAGANNVGLMGVKWTNVEDIPERTVEYEE